MSYQVQRFYDERTANTRFLVRHREEEYPVSLNYYESYLFQKSGSSHNTIYNTLQCLTFLYTWCEMKGIDLEQLFACGIGLDVDEIDKFAFWLTQREKRRRQQSSKYLSRVYRGQILRSCRAFFDFAIRIFGYRDLKDRRERARLVKLARFDQSEAWGEVTKTKPKRADEKPLTSEEVRLLEEHFLPYNRVKRGVSRAVALRDYIMWRLSLEFALRIGEILALELQHVFFGQDKILEIIPIEERGSDFIDPRAPYAPRVKTEGRTLGVMFEGSYSPSLLQAYVEHYRFASPRGRKRANLGHTFFFIEHHSNKGRPLSVASAMQTARRASEETGVPYHWHLGRHTFVDHATEAAQAKEANDAYKDHLAYVLGHADVRSQDPYARTARQKRAVEAVRSLHLHLS